MAKLEKKAAPIQKQCYSIKIEAMAPVTLTYRVWAETPEQALDSINSSSALQEAPRPTLSRMKKMKATVYQAGSNLIQLIRNF